MRKRHKTQYAGIWFRLVNEDRPDGPRRYIVGYTAADGKYHTETLPVGHTLEDARNRRGVLMGKRRTFVPTRKSIGVLLDEWLEARENSLKPKTYEDYAYGVSRVKDYIGHRQLQNLTASDCAEMIRKMKRSGLKTATVKKLLTPLQGALRVALREGWIQSNPLDLLLPDERPKADGKKMRVLGSEEIPKLLAHASSERWKTLFATLVLTGLRIGEALELKWEDFNVRENTLTVHSSKTQAGEREVMVIPDLKQALLKLHLSQAPGVEYVFANREGRPVARREALRALRAAEKRAKLPNYTLHELRHTFASILIAQGEQPPLIAAQMGHVNPKITFETYAHLFDAQKNVERARERLQEAFGGVV